MAKKKEESNESILETLEKKYGMWRPDIKNLTIVSTGSIQLDRAMKIGGTALGKMIEIQGQESSGKAQPLSCNILTPTGWIKMRDVQKGTIISTPDGKDSTVIGVFPQGEQDVYKITFDDKTFTHCTLDHLWFVNTRQTELGEVLSTKQLLELNIKRKNGCRNFKIPTVSPIEFEQFGSITIDPYLLGVILGNGGLTVNSVKVSIWDDETIDEVSKILNDKYDDVKLSEKMGQCTYNIKKKSKGHAKNEVWIQISELGLLNKYSYEKHIPKQYLYTSTENRVALLQGLMDTDGSVESGTLSYSTSSLQLNKDFEELVRSLGMRCTTSSRITKYNSPTGQKIDGRRSYRSSLLLNSFTFNPFRLLRKLDSFKAVRNLYSERFIENIELIGKEDCQCIMIGHPDQLYITDDFIVTHNTTVMLHQIAEYQKAFSDKKTVFLDFEHAFDPNYATAIGVDVEALLIYQPDDMESGYDMVLALVENDIICCAVIDSQTAAVPKAVKEGEMSDSTISLQARINSKFCLKIKGLLDIHKCTLFFVSQLRDRIGNMSGEGSAPTGGNAIKFYADARWKLWKTNDKLNETNKTTIDVIKSKIGKPFGQCKVDILWGVGFDKIGEVVNYAVDFGIMKRAGAWFSYESSNIGQGMEKTRLMLEDNPELYEEIRNKVMEKLNE